MTGERSTSENHRSLERALVAEIDRRELAAIDLLRALIQTPSVTGSEGDHRDHRSVAGQLWASLASEPAIRRFADPVSSGRDNVIALLGSSTRGVMVLDAHTDTVPGGEPNRWIGHDSYSAATGTVFWLGNDRIRLEIDGEVIERPVRRRLGRLWEARSFDSTEVIYGRGAFDNKGPVAVAWLATVALAAALEREGLELDGSLVTAFVVDEEDGMAGTRALAVGDRSWLARRGLLNEERGPDGLRQNMWGVALDGSYGFVPIVGHRGVAQMAMRTTGQAAHAATPSLGINAVIRMAAALHSLDVHHEELAASLDPLFADRLLEGPTLALGTTIAGGGVSRVVEQGGRAQVERSGINVVPDWCEATIDCRHPRPADGDSSTIQQRIAEVIAAFVEDRTGLGATELTVEVVSGGPPCAILDDPEQGSDDPLVGPILRYGEAISGFRPWVETAPGGTDATVLINEARIRTLVEFGPAGALAHEPHEFVERDQIAIGAHILARSIVEILGVRPVRG